MRTNLGITILIIAFAITEPTDSLWATSAQITLENRTKITLDLYVDGSYACRALGGLTCTAQTNPGPHRLEARDGSKTVADANDFMVEDGSSETWTVR
jgi:hypothetical protein